MKSSELLRDLKKAGCHKVREGKGSHEIWYSPITGKQMAVPNHGSKEMAKGMEKKIRKELLGV